MYYRITALLLFVAILATPLFAQDDAVTTTTVPASFNLIDSLISVSKTFIGKPYRFTSATGQKMDCSGFVSYVYSLFAIHLPRSSKLMANEVVRLTLAEVKKGDLLFFKGRSRKSKQVGHVGIVVEKNGD